MFLLKPRQASNSASPGAHPTRPETFENTSTMSYYCWLAVVGWLCSAPRTQRRCSNLGACVGGHSCPPTTWWSAGVPNRCRASLFLRKSDAISVSIPLSRASACDRAVQPSDPPPPLSPNHRTPCRSVTHVQQVSLDGPWRAGCCTSADSVVAADHCSDLVLTASGAPRRRRSCHARSCDRWYSAAAQPCSIYSVQHTICVERCLTICAISPYRGLWQ